MNKSMRASPASCANATLQSCRISARAPDGALPSKTKEIIAVAVAHVTRCPYCIRGHTERALQKGATEQEIMEEIWVAAEMRAGGAYAHSTLAVDAMNQTQAKPGA